MQKSGHSFKFQIKTYFKLSNNETAYRPEGVPGRLSSRELDSCKNSDVFLLIVSQSVVAADRVGGDDQRVVELSAVRVLTALNSESVGQT